MIILGGEKDFYDYIVHQYGEDEKILFDRRPHNGVDSKLIDKFSKLFYNRFGVIFPLLNTEHDRFRFLVFCGKVYLMYGVKCDYPNPFVPNQMIPGWKKHKVILSQDILDECVNKPLKTCTYHVFGREKHVKLERVNGVLIPELLELHKLINRPVFQVVINPRFEIYFPDYNQSNDGYLPPNLNAVGFPKILSAEQTYQQLAHFISNSLRDSPDAQPPVQIEEPLRIESHGFDRKVSFRHRK